MKWYEIRSRETKDSKKTINTEIPKKLRYQRFLGLVAESKNKETKEFLEETAKKELKKRIRIKEGLVFIENPETGIEEVTTVYEYCKKLAEEIIKK